MHGDIDLVHGFQPGQLAQRDIENEALGIADLGDGFQHAGKLNDVLRVVHCPCGLKNRF
jgi:hypothetical protein